MRFGKTNNAARAWLAALLIGSLGLVVAPNTNDRLQEIDNWSKAQVAYSIGGPRALPTTDAPKPPPTFALIASSASGAKLGFEISALGQNLGQILADDAVADSQEVVEIFEEVICLAISSLLENRVDPGSPVGLAETITSSLRARDLPHLKYSSAREEWKELYGAFKAARSTDKLSRQVAEAIPC